MPRSKRRRPASPRWPPRGTLHSRVLCRACLCARRHLVFSRDHPRQFRLLVWSGGEPETGRWATSVLGRSWRRRRIRFWVSSVCWLEGTARGILRLRRLWPPCTLGRVTYHEMGRSFPARRPSTCRCVRICTRWESGRCSTPVQQGESHALGHNYPWPRAFTRELNPPPSPIQVNLTMYRRRTLHFVFLSIFPKLL